MQKYTQLKIRAKSYYLQEVWDAQRVPREPGDKIEECQKSSKVLRRKLEHKNKKLSKNSVQRRLANVVAKMQIHMHMLC